MNTKWEQARELRYQILVALQIGPSTFADLRHFGGGGMDSDRKVDRALQTLRRLGAIRYVQKRWYLVEDASAVPPREP